MEATPRDPNPGILIRSARVVRSVWRIVRVAAVALRWSAALVLNRRHRKDRASRANWLRETCRAALRAFRVEATASGDAPRNSVIVPNHLGYLDVLAIASLTPVVFVAKREIASWPVLGWFARMAGTCFIDRRNRSDVVRVGKEIEAALAAGVSVVVFLEGTSSDGRGVLPFKSSLLEPVVRNRLRAAPAALVFTVPEGFSSVDDVCWWGDEAFAPHLFRLGKVSRVAVRVAWGEPATALQDRKALATHLRDQVVALHDMLCRAHSSQAASLAIRPPPVAGALRNQSSITVDGMPAG